MRLSYVLALVLAGCSNNNTTTTPDMAAPAADMAMAATPTCAAYCTAIMANCTGDGTNGMPANGQYTSVDNCMHSCAAMPVGAASDTSGNTLGCHLYHDNAAKGDPMLHCPHAGPGGDGVCGAVCDGYCQIAMKYCTSANGAQVYTDLNDCVTTCMAIPNDVRYNISVQDGAHEACLLYHVQEASTVPPDHCNDDLAKGDGGIKSVTCM